jgi:hypothetical protein
MADELETIDIHIDDIETKDNETMYHKIEVWMIEYAQSIGINHALPMVSEPQIKMYGTAEVLAININSKIADIDTRNEHKPYIMININFASIRVPSTMCRYFTCPVIYTYGIGGALTNRKIVNMDDHPRLRDIAFILYDAIPFSS